MSPAGSGRREAGDSSYATARWHGCSCSAHRIQSVSAAGPIAHQRMTEELSEAVAALDANELPCARLNTLEAAERANVHMFRMPVIPPRGGRAG
jgi:hypothetical protein